MGVTLLRFPEASREKDRLARKYQSAFVAIEQFKRLLMAGVAIGSRYRGLGIKRDNADCDITKYKVIVKELGGKSSGLRYIAERLTNSDGDSRVVCICLLCACEWHR